MAKLTDVLAVAVAVAVVVVVVVVHVGLIYFFAICVKNNNFKIQKMLKNALNPFSYIQKSNLQLMEIFCLQFENTV